MRKHLPRVQRWRVLRPSAQRQGCTLHREAGPCPDSDDRSVTTGRMNRSTFHFKCSKYTQMPRKCGCSFAGHGNTHVACLEDSESAETTGRENLCDVCLTRIYVSRNLKVAPLHWLHQHCQPVEDRWTLTAKTHSHVSHTRTNLYSSSQHVYVGLYVW